MVLKGWTGAGRIQELRAGSATGLGIAPRLFQEVSSFGDQGAQGPNPPSSFAIAATIINTIANEISRHMMMCSSGTFLLRAKPSPTEIGISAPKMIKTTFNRHLRLHAVTNLIVLCGQSVQFKLGHLPLPHFLAAWRNPRVVWLIPPILARFASSPHSIGDRWLSGLRHSTRNRAYPLKVPWVRLPPCPPLLFRGKSDFVTVKNRFWLQNGYTSR